MVFDIVNIKKINQKTNLFFALNFIFLFFSTFCLEYVGGFEDFFSHININTQRIISLMIE
jgi:hypothetical protein